MMENIWRYRNAVSFSPHCLISSHSLELSSAWRVLSVLRVHSGFEVYTNGDGTLATGVIHSPVTQTTTNACSAKQRC